MIGEEETGFDKGPLLVTGASSQIGLCLLRRLDKIGAIVFAVSRHRPAFVENSFKRFIECDLTHEHPTFPEEVSSLIHVAGIWLLSPHLETLRNIGLRRLVCFSSTAIYNKTDSVNSGERDIARRMVQAEEDIARKCESFGIAQTVLRPTLVYGLGLDRNVSRAAHFIRHFRFFPLALGAVGLRQPVHADDLANAALVALATDAAKGKCYDVGGGERIAYRDMIGRIFDVLETPRRFLPLPGLEYAVAAAGFLFRRPEITGDVIRRMRLNLVCDNSGAITDLGYSPRTFLAGGKDDLPL